MVTTALILGFIGVGLFFIIMMSFAKLLEKDESGFLHLLLSLMFLCWLPIPIVFNFKQQNHGFLLIGTLFGMISLILMITTMVMQAGHLTYSSKKCEEDEKYWNEKNKWILNGLLGGQLELLALFLKSIWILFVTICFWINEQHIFGVFGTLLSFFTLIYLIRLLDLSLVKECKILKKVKTNVIITNLETTFCFVLVLIWLMISA